jgi:trehalose/maltose hydrolase-like predicted phosphorylase
MGNSGAAYPLHTQNNESCNESHNHLAQNSSIALAFNTWNFFNITGDKNFLNEFGTELYLDICRFWASKTEYNSKTGKYEIADNIKVVCNENGKNDDNKYLRNNAYTNLMVVWLFTHAFDLIKELSHDKKVEVFARIGLTDTELFEWSEKARKMQINVSTDGIIELFDGYFNLPIDAKKPKQAGVLMAFYRMGIKDTEAVVFNLGNDIPKDFVEKNFYYYFNKSTKSSPQKRLIQASIAAQLGKKELAWNLFFDALKGDYCITPDYNTAEGVHLGVMTNSVVTALAAFAGLNISGEIIRLKPNLPNHWKDISFCCSFKGVEYNIKIDHKKVVVQTQSENARILVNEVEFKVKPSQKLEIDIV